MFGIIHVAVSCCATVVRCLRKAHAKSESRATSASDYAMTCKCHVTIADAVHSFQFCGGANGGGSHPLLFLMYGELKTARDSYLLRLLQRRNLQILDRVREINRLVQVSRA